MLKVKFLYTCHDKLKHWPDILIVTPFWTLHQWILNQNTNIFFQQNVFKDAMCRMAAISRHQWVNVITIWIRAKQDFRLVTREQPLAKWVPGIWNSETCGCRTFFLIMAFPFAPFYSLWPRAVILLHRSGSILAQVMTWCCQAPSHHLNQCWLLMKGVLWHSPECKRSTYIHELNP